MPAAPRQSPKRGAILSPRSVLAAATPHVAISAAPPNFIIKPQQISMWGNDVNGDCVTAEEAFAKACNNPEIFISDNEVITWATNHNVLNGAGLPQVMQFMQNDGFVQAESRYNDGPYLSVSWTDPATLQSAISSGPVKIGIICDPTPAGQLERVWGSTNGQTGWFATGFHSEAGAAGAEGHCVSLCGYGTLAWLAQQLGVQVPAGVDGTKQGYAMFTWDSIGIIDEPSMLAITEEAWLRRPTTVTAPPPMVEAQKIACNNKAGFVMSFLAVTTGGASSPTDNYPIAQTRVIDLGTTPFREGGEFWPEVHAFWGKIQSPNQHVVFKMNGQTATYDVSGTTLIYSISLIGGEPTS